MDKKLVEDAYRKLKGSVYLDKTVPFLRIRIAEYVIHLSSLRPYEIRQQTKLMH